MSPNQAQPARNVKIRRVRNATRGLAVFGVAAAVLVLVLLLAVAQPAAGADAGGTYQYARSHVTLYGKIAALSHHDVLKTTEPLTCSDGVQNFTCLLSKTDITPVLRELRKIGVRPEVSPVARRWVLVLDFNFTEGSWRWRNITVVSGWELKWNNETAYVFQTQIKKSLGEMIKIQKEVTWRLLVKEELKGVTGVGVVLDKIIVTTENATATQNTYTSHQKKAVDPAAAKRIKRFIKSIDPEVEVEVLYDKPEPTQSRYDRFRPVVGGIKIEQVYRGPDFDRHIPGCTLGFTGVVINTPVVLTAWHCIRWTGTDRTSGQAEIYQPDQSSWNLIADSIWVTCSYLWENNKLVTSCDIVAMRSMVPREPRVFKPTESSTPQYGQVVRRLGKYDVGLFSELVKAGITTDVTRGRLISHNFDAIYTEQRWGDLTFDVVVCCNVLVAMMRAEDGDSGGPVYRFEGSNDGLGAYGIQSGTSWLGAVVSNIGYLIVSVDPTR